MHRANNSLLSRCLFVIFLPLLLVFVAAKKKSARNEEEREARSDVGN